MGTFDEQRKKAFEFCADAAKQLITLATGIVTITITFAKDFITSVPESTKLCAYVAWFIYLASIVFGMLTLLSLTAELEPKKETQKAIPTIRGSAATYSALQIFSFAIAILMTIFFAMKAINQPTLPKINSKEHISKIDTIAVNLNSLNIIINKDCKKNR